MPDALIRLRLLRLGRAARNARLAGAGLRWLAQTLGLGLACFWLDNLLRLPPAGRGLLLAAAVAVPGWTLWRRALQHGAWRVRPERTARELEDRCGIRDNTLISAVQFEAALPAGPSAFFARRTVETGAAAAARLTAAPLADPRRLWQVALAALVCAAVWGAYVALFPRFAGNAWQRFSRPLADVPPLGAFDVRLAPCGRVVVAEGESLVFSATIASGTNRGPRLRGAPVLRLARRRDGAEAVEVPMHPAGGGWRATVENVQEAFAARVLADDSWSPAATVEVRRRPRLVSALFRVEPPAYTGLKPDDRPGPPAALAVPEGSRVETRVTLDADADGLAWQVGTNRVAGSGRRRAWRVSAPADASGEYHVVVLNGGEGQEAARGSLLAQPDRPPEVALAVEDRNRLVWPGEAVELPVTADDDYGVRDVAVVARNSAREGDPPFVLARFSYAGPPGRRGVTEKASFAVDPARFEPGESYAVEARARDFSPAGREGRSAPVVLRVRRPQDAAAGSAAARAALDALQQAVEAQRRALGLSRNLELHLDEALQAGHLERHRAAMSDAQSAARRHGQAAQPELAALSADAASRLAVLVEREMPWALEDIGRLQGADRKALAGRAAGISNRQTYILTELLSLFGRAAAAARAQGDKGAAAGAPPPSPDEAMRELRDLLKDFAKAEKRILEESQALLARKPQDLTDEERAILGQLAREEQKWADLLHDKLNDLAKMPAQDFADGSLAQDLNAIWQDVARAAAELYAKNVELAVPQEQAGLENAKTLEQNLERWLSDRPDNLKWSMEEPPRTPDAPLAELPDELEDIAGELLDREEAMTEEVEDITSSWIDSMDKGVGWDAMDGPISDMSAKGVTGNLLPNQMEIAGRSGEGRTGRSDGQMVGATAEGKDGRQTPSRLTATPFEPGSVEDSSKQDPGGATGGGKLSGFAGRGLRGPAPPPRLDQMQRLAGKQAEIRQAAEKLSLGLRRHALPSGNIEEAVRQMRRVETLAKAGNGAGIRRAFSEAVGAMREQRDVLREATEVRREHGGLSRQEAEALWSGLQDDVPAGYEDLVAAYYKRMAEGAR